MEYGFSFRGVVASTVGISMATPSRSIKPSLRGWEYTIPGRSGTIEYTPDDDIYNKITITVPIIYTASDVASLNTVRRNIGSFLSGVGELIFDDEPDKYYTARLVESPTPEEIINIGKATLVFECQPFAEDIDLSEQESGSVNLPHTETVTVSGTADTPCVIYITAGTAITDLTIERKAIV